MGVLSSRFFRLGFEQLFDLFHYAKKVNENVDIVKHCIKFVNKIMKKAVPYQRKTRILFDPLS